MHRAYTVGRTTPTTSFQLPPGGPLAISQRQLALRLRAFKGQLRIVRMLIEAGAPVGTEYYRGGKLHTASTIAESKFEELLKLITSGTPEADD